MSGISFPSRSWRGCSQSVFCPSLVFWGGRQVRAELTLSLDSTVSAIVFLVLK